MLLSSDRGTQLLAHRFAMAIVPAPRQIWHFVQQPVWHPVRRAQILASRQPVKQRDARPLLAFFRLTAGSGATLCGEARQGNPYNREQVSLLNDRQKDPA
tara:strand:- start:6467 stop:6766 length:300 start_codon:yes stop_codon:yes gene_type:complete